MDGSCGILASGRYDLALSRQSDIAFPFCIFMLSFGAMIALFGSFKIPVPILAKHDGMFARESAAAKAQKSSGAIQAPGSVLAYPVKESGVPGALASATSRFLAQYDQWTAVYVISAHTVFMPDGRRLEAHSGLGDRLDNPRHVHEKMRGATPPDVYELAPREQLFHGVRALRLNPVGGGKAFGRAGFLAHTYMLGSSGASHGCVVFKHYEEFLRAYLNHQVRRLVVVTHLD